MGWVEVGSTDEIDEEDVMRFDHDGATYAIYNTPSGFFATDGYCTHEAAHLADGLVMEEIIECPMHQGRFHITSGEQRGGPVCEKLKTYPVKIEGGVIFVGRGGPDVRLRRRATELK